MYKLGNGRSIHVWKDVWFDNCPFNVRFVNLFRICENPDICVDKCCDKGVWNIKFNRSFGVEERKQWEELKLILDGVMLEDKRDSLGWLLDSHGQFSVKSLYRHLTNGGVTNWKLKKVWASSIPLKVKIVLWQLHHNRIPTTDQLKIRGWKGVEKCSLCGVLEDANHVLFKCVIAKFVWCCNKEIMHWDRVSESLDEFYLGWLDKKGANEYHVGLFSFAALA